jgi:hypothetical protein
MRVLLILFVIYLAFQVFFRFILPLFGRYMVIKASKHMQSQFGQSRQKQHYATERKTGEVRIEKNPPKSQPTNNDDYTDFEEVK